MNKVLYINGNPQKEELSFTRRAGQYYLEQLKKTYSQDEIKIINVYEEYIQLIDEEVLQAWTALRKGTIFSDLTLSQRKKLNNITRLLAQFKHAEQYVFVTPLWNFGIPPMLKAYIDSIMIAGETFKYTENGPIGLMSGKKAIIIQASGGVYSDGLAKEMEHGTNYIKTTLAFMGIEDVTTFLVEGVAIQDKSPEERLEEVYKQIDQFINTN